MRWIYMNNTLNVQGKRANKIYCQWFNTQAFGRIYFFQSLCLLIILFCIMNTYKIQWKRSYKQDTVLCLESQQTVLIWRFSVESQLSYSDPSHYVLKFAAVLQGIIFNNNFTSQEQKLSYSLPTHSSISISLEE